MPRFLRFGWDRIDAELIGHRFVRRERTSQHGSWFQVWEYIVELPGVDGVPVRLAFKDRTYKVDLPPVGDAVPVLVNRKRTKAMFDLDDPRIDAVGRREAKEKRRKARDKERFDKRLEGS